MTELIDRDTARTRGTPAGAVRVATGARPETPAARPPAPLAAPLALLRAVPHLGTYAGIALIIAAGALLALAWGRVAGTLNVGLQMPYLASAGFTGLGLAICGVALVVVDARATDAKARAVQLDELAAVLREIRETLESGLPYEETR